MNFSETKSQRGSIAIFVLILEAFGVAILTAFLQESIFHVKYCSSARPPVNLTVQAYSFSDLMLIYLTEINSVSTPEHEIAGFDKENPTEILITNKDLDPDSGKNKHPIVNPVFSYRLTEKLLKKLKDERILPSFFSFDFRGRKSLADSNIYEIEVSPKSGAPNNFIPFKVTYYLEDLLDKVPLCEKFQEGITFKKNRSLHLWDRKTLPDFSRKKLRPDNNFPIQSWNTVAEKLGKPNEWTIPKLKKYFTINPFVCKDADDKKKRDYVKINLCRCNQDVLKAILVEGKEDGYSESNLTGELSSNMTVNGKPSHHFCSTMRYFTLTTRVTSGIKSVSVRITCRTTPLTKGLGSDPAPVKNRLPFEVLNVEEF